MKEEHLVFTDIYDEFYPKILHYLKRLVGEQEAEGINQTVFEKISRNIDTFKGESKVSTWIYRIATNAALDKLKSSSFRHSQSGPLAPLPIHIAEIENPVTTNKDNYTPPDNKIIHDEMNECIREFVDKLPPDYRTIIALKELDGFTNKEIAEILEISLDTAKIRLHRARAKLRKNLEAGCDFYHDDQSELACDRKQDNTK